MKANSSARFPKKALPSFDSSASSNRSSGSNESLKILLKCLRIRAPLTTSGFERTCFDVVNNSRSELEKYGSNIFDI